MPGKPVAPVVLTTTGRGTARDHHPDDDLYITTHRLSELSGHTAFPLQPSHWQVVEAELDLTDPEHASATIEASVVQVADLFPAFVSAFVVCAGDAINELADWVIRTVAVQFPVAVCRWGPRAAINAKSLLRPGPYGGHLEISGDLSASSVHEGLTAASHLIPDLTLTGNGAAFTLTRWDFTRLGVIANLVCQSIGLQPDAAEDDVVKIEFTVQDDAHPA